MRGDAFGLGSGGLIGIEGGQFRGQDARHSHMQSVHGAYGTGNPTRNILGLAEGSDRQRTAVPGGPTRKSAFAMAVESPAKAAASSLPVKTPRLRLRINDIRVSVTVSSLMTTSGYDARISSARFVNASGEKAATSTGESR
jgi:hypothetical protein